MKTVVRNLTVRPVPQSFLHVLFLIVVQDQAASDQPSVHTTMKEEVKQDSR